MARTGDPPGCWFRRDLIYRSRGEDLADRAWDEIDALSERIIGAAIEVHEELGPGLLERTYQRCLAWELEQEGLNVGEDVSVPIRYKDANITDTYRLDLVVEDLIVLELKKVSHVLPVHRAQLLRTCEWPGSPSACS